MVQLRKILFLKKLDNALWCLRCKFLWISLCNYWIMEWAVTTLSFILSFPSCILFYVYSCFVWIYNSNNILNLVTVRIYVIIICKKQWGLLYNKFFILFHFFINFFFILHFNTPNEFVVLHNKKFKWQ